MPSNFFKLQPGGVLHGQIRVPGDKSISHRAVMLGAIAEGKTEVNGFLEGADCLATLKAFQAMGVKVERPDAEKLIIHGVGLDGLQPPSTTLDLGNSGTSIRLLTGLLAGQKFTSHLTGDASLRRRPMARVVNPLRQMGAQIDLQSNGCPPLVIYGQQTLHGMHYQMPIPSAQVKSSLLLAGLYAEGETQVTELVITRDHTERMLSSFGYPVLGQASTISIPGKRKLIGTTITVPGDISSAAFFIVGATIAPGSHLVLQQVGVNPTRTGIITILQAMGANIRLLNETMLGAEPIADIEISSSKLTGITIPKELVSLAIDEFPIIFIAAACAEGETILQGAEELRVKESDRIQTMVDGLKKLGITAEATADGAIIQGGQIHGGRINSHGDHRVAMSFAMAALRAKDEVIIDDCANVATSFPNFVELGKEVGLKIN